MIKFIISLLNLKQAKHHAQEQNNSILFSVLSVHILSWIGDDNMRSFSEWLETNFQWMTLNKLLSLGVAFFSAFTMFNWWLSYQLFTRSQVVKPKFRLL